MSAARRLEIERLARAIDVADTDDFHTFLVAWQWHNPDSKDAAAALMMAAKRMGGAINKQQAEAVIEEADIIPQCRTADAVGKYLGLTDELRTMLGIKTIGACDVTKRQRARRRRAQDRKHKEAKRRMKGAKPRAAYLANSLSRTQPWKTERVSRRTWYYRNTMRAEPTPYELLPVVQL
jgi:hypothetical protein